MKYKLTDHGIQRDDGALIPDDNDNIDWQEYQSWLSKGNKPAAKDAAVVIKDLKNYADKVARKRLKSATGGDGSDFEVLRSQVSMIARAVHILNKNQSGKATAKEIRVLKKLEALGNKKEKLDEVRDLIKSKITEATTQNDIDNDPLWPAA